MLVDEVAVRSSGRDTCDVGWAGGVERLDLDEPVGTGPIEAEDDNIGCVGEAGAGGVHPASKRPSALALVEEDGGRAEASAEDDGEGAHGRVVARLLPADADGALQVVSVSGLDGGGIGRRHHIGGREEAAVAVGDVTLTGDARKQEEVKREGGRKIRTRINEAEEPAACARRAMRGRLLLLLKELMDVGCGERGHASPKGEGTPRTRAVEKTSPTWSGGRAVQSKERA